MQHVAAHHQVRRRAGAQELEIGEMREVQVASRAVALHRIEAAVRHACGIRLRLGADDNGFRLGVFIFSLYRGLAAANGKQHQRRNKQA